MMPIADHTACMIGYVMFLQHITITRSRTIAGRTERCRCKFWYISKSTTASRGFHCDSNVFELSNSANHGKIEVLNISIYCLEIHYLTHIVCAINISNRSKY